MNRDHALVIPKACQPGAWFGAGSAFIAPLYRKRALLLERAKLVHVWTLYNAKVATEDWLTPPDTNPTLHMAIEVRGHSPSGWYFTIPQPLRARGWLPESGGVVFFEFGATEANVWTVDAYNEETLLEADEGR